MNVDIPGRIERYGFAVVEAALDPSVVEALVVALGGLVAGASPSALDRGGEVYASRNLLRDVPAVRSLARSAAVRALVEPVLGPGAFPVRGLLFDKTPGANWTVPWHQDLAVAVRERRDAPGFRAWTVKAGVPHVQPPASVLAAMLTVRLHLDACGPDNGPLRVVPGSHRDGRLDDSATRSWLERVEPVPCLVGRGGALLMRPLLLHASSPADVPGHRRVIHFEFATGSLPSGVEWHESRETIEGHRHEVHEDARAGQ